MSIQSVAEVLCRSIEDGEFARKIDEDPTALASFELTQEELAAFHGARAEDSALTGVPVGAFRLVARGLNSLDPSMRQRLNKALAMKGGTGPGIPCTGSKEA